MKLIERAGRTRLSLSLSLSLSPSHPSLQPSVTFWTPLNVDLRGQSVTIRKRDMDATAAIIKNNNASSSNESGGVSSALLPPDMRFGEAQIITISVMSVLFVMSSVLNLKVLANLMAARRSVGLSRLNTLLLQLVLADLSVRFTQP